METFSSYTCINCRKSPLVGGDAIMPCVAAESATNNFLETDEEEVEEELSFMVRSTTTAPTSSHEIKPSNLLMPNKRSKRQHHFSPSPSRNIFSTTTSFSGNSSPITTINNGDYGSGEPALDDFLITETGVNVACSGLFTSEMSSPLATGTEESCSTRDESPQIQNDQNVCSDNDEYKPPR